MTLAGKNVGAFDLQWLKRYVAVFEKYGELFRHRSLDPGSMYARPEDEKVPGLLKCLERAELEPSGYHTALGDAWDVICLIRKHWNYDLDSI